MSKAKGFVQKLFAAKGFCCKSFFRAKGLILVSQRASGVKAL